MANVLRRPDSKFWIASFTDSRGRQLKRSTKSTDKETALKIADAYEKAATGGKMATQARAVITELLASNGMETVPEVTVTEWGSKWLARKMGVVAGATQLFYQLCTKDLLAWLGTKADGPLSQLDVGTLLDYRASLARDFSICRVNARMAAIKMLLGAAQLERIIPSNPADFVRPLRAPLRQIKDRREPFTLEQIRLLLNVAPPEWKSMILFGAYLGQRLSDIATLRWDQINIESGMVSLQTRKTGRMQNLPMSPALRMHLLSWEEGRTKRDAQRPEEMRAYIHPRLAGYILRTNFAGKLSNEFAELMVQAGIRKSDWKVAGREETAGTKRRKKHRLSFHSLRHTATSWMKEAGVPVSVVMDFVGHDDAAMSQLYTHSGEAAMRRAAESMPMI